VPLNKARNHYGPALAVLLAREALFFNGREFMGLEGVALGQVQRSQ
jgi:hypothetical protein